MRQREAIHLPPSPPDLASLIGFNVTCVLGRPSRLVFALCRGPSPAQPERQLLELFYPCLILPGVFSKHLSLTERPYTYSVARSWKP